MTAENQKLSQLHKVLCNGIWGNLGPSARMRSRKLNYGRSGGQKTILNLSCDIKDA